MLSERDVVREAARDERLFGRTVGEIMTRDVIVGVPEDDLRAVRHTMTERRIRTCRWSRMGGWSASCRSGTSSRPSSTDTSARWTPCRRRSGPGRDVRLLRARRRSDPHGRRTLTSMVGTEGRPLRVAIIGAGPAGFYTAEQLFRQPGLAASVDLYDRLPTPYGLVRFGVARTIRRSRTSRPCSTRPPPTRGSGSSATSSWART